MNHQIIKQTIKTSLPISGHFKYEDVFQIYPSTIKHSNITEKWLDIEYNTKYHNHNQIVNNISDNNDKEEYIKHRKETSHINFLKILISLLTISTNNKYEDPNQGWVGNNISKGNKIEKFSEINDLHSIRKNPNRIFQDFNSCSEFLSIQDTCDLYFKKYFSLSEDSKKRYNASIFLYNNMTKVRPISASLSIIGYISSIENLADHESKIKGETIERCEKCGQLMYKVSRKFKDFMKKYSSFDKDINSNKVIDQFYSRRSKITHAGELLYMDYIQNEFPVEEYRYLVSLEKHVRVALYNYLILSND